LQGVPIAKRRKANEAVAEFFFQNPTIPPHVLRKASFKALVKAIREAPEGWTPPDPVRYVLGDRLDAVRAQLQEEVCQPPDPPIPSASIHAIHPPPLHAGSAAISVHLGIRRPPHVACLRQMMKGKKAETLKAFGGTLTGDGATVNGQPLTNAMLVLADEKPTCLEISNVSHLIRAGGKKGGLYYAEQLTEAAKKLTPDNGRHVDLMITDTPSDMQRCWRISMNLCPWLFCQPCVSHCGNVLLKQIAAIPVVGYMLEWMLQVGAEFLRRGGTGCVGMCCS
jgi:hypothetical protein